MFLTMKEREARRWCAGTGCPGGVMMEHGSAEMVRSKIVPRRGDDGGRPLGD